MRVIAGRLKGRTIKVNKEIGFRPVLGIVKEAVFDMLQFKIEPDDIFLDLFGGTGGMGIEAYSRGINHVYINELDKNNYKRISENVENFQIQDNVSVFNKDFRNFLDYIQNQNIIFDYLYIAPPYKDKDFYVYVLNFFDSHPDLLSESSLLFFEYHKRTVLDFSRYEIYKEKKYGSTCLTILRKRKNNA